MKKYYKYVLWVVAFYLLTHFLIFVAFNSNYKPIQIKGNVPEQISIEKAEATKSQVRIYGTIQNSEQNYLNGKFIKATAYNSNNELLATEEKIIDIVSPNEKKSFEFNFNAKDCTSYEINIVDNK